MASRIINIIHTMGGEAITSLTLPLNDENERYVGALAHNVKKHWNPHIGLTVERYTLDSTTKVEPLNPDVVDPEVGRS